MRFFSSLILILSFSSCAHAAVRLGDERLTESTVTKLLEGKKIAVLAHNASRDSHGNHVIDLLASVKGVSLKMILSPEHGLRSTNDAPVGDSIDTVTGLPVYSLYGPRKAPTLEMLSQIDAIVVDLQDVGLRYYTYVATMVNTMKVAASAHKQIIVLDRPNPLGGVVVDGPLLDESLIDGGLLTLAKIPTRHGMTIGEIAQFLNLELNIGVSLNVVSMRDWTRPMKWNDTKLPWTPSSPALVHPEQVRDYALTGPLEAVPFAVGRGQNNERAFTIFGAPWILKDDESLLVQKLNDLKILGLTFLPIEWTPDRAIFEGELCRGFQIVWNEKSNDADFETLMKILIIAKSVLGDRMDLSKMAIHLGGTWIVDALQNATSVSEILARARVGQDEFLSKRKSALLY